MLLITILYSRNIPEIKEAVIKSSKFSVISKQSLCQYFSLGAPCAIMVALEWWAYQLIMLFSGIIGVPE